MKAEEKKRWLLRYRACMGEVEKTCGELNRWRLLAQGTTAAYERGGTKGRRAVYSRVEAAACAMADLQNDLPEKVEEMTTVRSEVERAIGGVCTPKLRQVLYLRYVQGLTFAGIGKKMRFSEYYVSCLHKEALGVVQVPGEGWTLAKDGMRH